jgi:chemotaxis signal transduction protein
MDQLRNVVIIEVGAQVPVAAELRWVRETTTLGFVTFLPSAPRPICGVVNAHGTIIPVVDLAELLALPSAGLPRQGDPALVVEAEHVVAAFRVEAIRHVATLPSAGLGPIPAGHPLAAQAASERVGDRLVEQVIDRDGTLVPLLDLPTLLRRCSQLVSAAVRAGSAPGAP